MPATQTVADFGRIAQLGEVCAVVATVTAGGAVYATASGGLPIDLTSIIQQVSPFSAPINPGDVVGVVALGMSANGFLPTGITLGTPTFTTLPGASVKPAQVLATFPATVRLVGIGAAATNHAGLGEIVDGAVTDTFKILLLIARGGTNA